VWRRRSWIRKQLRPSEALSTDRPAQRDRAQSDRHVALNVPATIAKAAAPFGAALIWSLSSGYTAVLWTVFAGGLVAVAGFWFASNGRTRNTLQ
jgi:hypothetical protein